MVKSSAKSRTLLRCSLLAIVIILSMLILGYLYFLSTVSTVTSTKASFKDATFHNQQEKIESTHSFSLNQAEPTSLRATRPLLLTNYLVEMVVANGDGNETGTILFEIHNEWAPLGAAQFKKLVEADFFVDVRFFRVIKKFMAQFGINGDSAVNDQWKTPILDDPVKSTNDRGTLTFATSGKNSRSTQLFINFVNNRFLDKQGFSPIGKIVEGMEVLDSIFSGYGEGGMGDGNDGKGPSQGRIKNQGNAYLKHLFPKLSYIQSARVVDRSLTKRSETQPHIKTRVIGK